VLNPDVGHQMKAGASKKLDALKAYSMAELVLVRSDWTAVHQKAGCYTVKSHGVSQVAGWFRCYVALFAEAHMDLQWTTMAGLDSGTVQGSLLQVATPLLAVALTPSVEAGVKGSIFE